MAGTVLQESARAAGQIRNDRSVAEEEQSSEGKSPRAFAAEKDCGESIGLKPQRG
jgi:hypothetical protein